MAAQPTVSELAAVTGKVVGGFWPSSVQAQLLVAALAEPAEAVAAWRETRSSPSFDLDTLEPGSFELLPLIYRNLLAVGDDRDPLAPRLKGIYRKSWVVTNLLLKRTRETHEALAPAGVEALFVEGATLAVRYYPDLGSRYTPFVDVLVREADFATALTRMPRAGWFERPASFRPSSQRFLFDRDGHACRLRSTLSPDFALPEQRGRSLDELLAAAEGQDIGGADVPVMPATETLLAVCVSGARATAEPSIQWLVDAAMILHAREIAWNRLLELGTARGQTTRLSNALPYLAHLPGVNIPESVLDRLAATPTTLRERLAYRCAAATSDRLGAFPGIVAEHLAVTAGDSPARTLARFPGHLRREWDVGHGWLLPVAAGRRAVRLLRGGSRRTA